MGGGISSHESSGSNECDSTGIEGIGGCMGKAGIFLLSWDNFLIFAVLTGILEALLLSIYVKEVVSDTVCSSINTIKSIVKIFSEVFESLSSAITAFVSVYGTFILVSAFG